MFMFSLRAYKSVNLTSLFPDPCRVRPPWRQARGAGAGEGDGLPGGRLRAPEDGPPDRGHPPPADAQLEGPYASCQLPLADSLRRSLRQVSSQDGKSVVNSVKAERANWRRIPDGIPSLISFSFFFIINKQIKHSVIQKPSFNLQLCFTRFQVCGTLKYGEQWAYRTLKHLALLNFNRATAITALWTLTACYMPGVILYTRILKK